MFPRLLLICGLLATLTACRTAEPQPNGTADTAASPAVASDPAGLATPMDAAITVWTVPAFAPASEDGEATAFGALLDAYRRANPEQSVNVALKPDYGPDGIVAHLSSTAEVVPGNLPDVAIVPIGSITDTIAAGIAQPIVDAALVELAFDAFPFASSRASDPQGTARAVPFAVDVRHAIGREDVPPKLEDLGSGSKLVVPLGADSIQATAMLLGAYTHAGGALPLLPDVSMQALTETLTSLHTSAVGGQVEFIEGAGTGRAAWNVFLDQGSGSGAAAVDGGVFVWRQGNFPALTWGQLPGVSRPMPPIAWGWAYIVTVRDEDRRVRAEALVAYMTQEQQRDWVLQAGHLPAWPEGWRSAVAGVVEPEPVPEYLDFLVDQLIRAVSADSPSRWATAWSNALAEIAAGGTAEDAVRQIVPDRE